MPSVLLKSFFLFLAIFLLAFIAVIYNDTFRYINFPNVNFYYFIHFLFLLGEKNKHIIKTLKYAKERSSTSKNQ